MRKLDDSTTTRQLNDGGATTRKRAVDPNTVPAFSSEQQQPTFATIMRDVKPRYGYRGSARVGPRDKEEIGEELEDVPIHCSNLKTSLFRTLRFLGSQDSIPNGAGHCPFDNERQARCSRLQSASGSVRVMVVPARVPAAV
jgi:hypothetical protein